MPPYPLPDEKTKSTIKSDSSLGGGGSNEIRFEDKKGNEEIYLHGQKDWTILIENDKNQTIGHDETLLVKNNRTKTVGVDQSETIGSNKTIKVGVNHTEAIGANMRLLPSGPIRLKRSRLTRQKRSAWPKSSPSAVFTR